MLVDTTLEVAEDVEATGCVVAEVAEGLHRLAPGCGLVVPAGVAVELLVVLDVGLDERLLAYPLLLAVVVERPHAGYIDLDVLVDDAQLIEPVYNFERLVNGHYVVLEVVVREDGSRLEPLGHAGLFPARTGRVAPLGHQSKGSFGNGVPERVVREPGVAGGVVSARVRLLDGEVWEALDAVEATGQADALGPLVACVGGAREVAVAG